MKTLFKILLLFISFCMALPSYTLSASNDIQVKLPIFKVTVNGTIIDTVNSKYPLLIYKDITYFPMTFNYASALGLITEWNQATGFGVSKNPYTTNTPIVQDLTGFNSSTLSYDAVIPSFKVKVNGKEIENTNEEYPLFVFRDITYFPMTWRFAVTEFGFNTSWNAAEGFMINTSSMSTGSNTNPISPVTSGLTLDESIVFTIAGNGSKGAIDDVGQLAKLDSPFGLTIDKEGNVYIADTSNHQIRKIDSIGNVTTLAGTGNSGSNDGPGKSATFSCPNSVAVDDSGNVYVADTANSKIRKIDQMGVVTTVAGTGSTGAADGKGQNASFYYPAAIALDGDGNLYIADSFNNKVRKIDSNGNVSTLAGNGTKGSSDGMGTNASFNQPNGLAVDQFRNLYVTDSGNSKIRKIDVLGNVTTIAGTGTAGSTDGMGLAASFKGPRGLAVDNFGNLFIADSSNHQIRRLDPYGNVTTIAGTGKDGYTDAVGKAALFNTPYGIAVDEFGSLYVSELFNQTIRKIMNKNSGSNPYIVSYKPNGASDGKVPVDSGIYRSTNMVTVLGNTGNLQRKGYNFRGWSTSPNGIGKIYTADQTFKMGTRNVSLYAQWELIDGSSSGIKTIEEVALNTNKVVYIEIYDFNGKAIASGSGFIVSPDGKIVTNYHVIEDASYIQVKLNNGATYPCRLILNTDVNQDLALLKIDATNLPFVTIGDSNRIKLGETVVAIGSPLGLQNTVSTGIISTTSRYIDGMTFIQTTAPIDHGSSGGALFNMRGEVIGVTSSGYTSQASLNLAIPSSILQSFLVRPYANIPVVAKKRLQTVAEINQYLKSTYGKMTIGGKTFYIEFDAYINDSGELGIIMQFLGVSNYIDFLDVEIAKPFVVGANIATILKDVASKTNYKPYAGLFIKYTTSTYPITDWLKSSDITYIGNGKWQANLYAYFLSVQNDGSIYYRVIPNSKNPVTGTWNN